MVRPLPRIRKSVFKVGITGVCKGIPIPLVEENVEDDYQRREERLADGADQKALLCDPQPETKEDVARAAEDHYG